MKRKPTKKKARDERVRSNPKNDCGCEEGEYRGCSNHDADHNTQKEDDFPGGFLPVRFTGFPDDSTFD